MATFRELTDRVLDGSKRAGLTDTTEVKSLINQAYLEMSMTVRPNVVDYVQTLVVDDGLYSVANDWLLTDVQDVRHMRITDSVTAQNYLLERVMVDYILMLQQTQSTSGGYMKLYAFDGIDTVRFYPAPSSTTTLLTMTYVQRPALLSAESDVPVGIPVEFHDVIVLGAIARAVRIWNPSYAADYRNYYKQGISDYRRWMNRFGGSMATKVIVKGSRTNTALHDNSTYYSGMR